MPFKGGSVHPIVFQVKGAFNRSALGTLVERKMRFVILCRMDGCTVNHTLEGFTRQMKKLPAFLRDSLTYVPKPHVTLKFRHYLEKELHLRLDRC